MYDAPAGEVVTADGHIGIVVGQINQSHVEYDGQSQKPYEKIGGLQLSPDGKHVGYIATMSPKRFLVIDGEEKEVPVGAVDALALGPGGHYACAGGANSAQLILDGVLEGPTDVQFAGRPAITFSPEGDHIAYLVDRQERGTTPFAGGAPLPIRRQYVVLDGALQTLPDEEGNATDRLTYSADGRRLAYIVQSMSQPTLGPDGRPLIGRAGMSKMIQRLVVDGIATDTFNEIREPVFSADGKHYACFAKRAGIDPIERDDQWYIVLDGAPAPCRKPLSQVPYFDAHDIVHAYTASLGQGPWNLTDVYRMDARSK